jgi:endonuclease III
MKKSNIELITSYLDSILPDASCELKYNTDYELVIAVILSSQVTDKKVNEVTDVLFDKYKTLASLKEVNIEQLKEILKPLGMYQKKALFIKDAVLKITDKYNGVVPNSRKELESIHGVGRKVANVILSVLYAIPAIAVDTHVKRIAIRLGIANKKDNNNQIENNLMDILKKDRWSKTHHQLVLFGRYYCTAINPKCENCVLKQICKKDML